jgi:hypothetical protein
VSGAALLFRSRFPAATNFGCERDLFAGVGTVGEETIKRSSENQRTFWENLKIATATEP